MRALLVSFACLLVAACVTEQDRAPCSASGECLPGFRCEAEACVPCDESQPCETPAEGELGPAGGRFCAAGACLDVASGALDGYVVFTIRTTVGNVGSLEAASSIFEIGPTSTELELSSSVELMVSGSTLPPDQLAIYRGDSSNGPWEMLVTEAGGEGLVAGTDRVGFFVAATK